MSLVTDLFNTFGAGSMGETARALGLSEQSISRGMRTAGATVLGGLLNKSPDTLQKIMDMAPAGMAERTSLSSAITDPGSPVLSTGKRMLSMLFGGSEGNIMHALSADTGLPAGLTSSLMATAAPMVASFLGKWTGDEGMGAAGLASLLQREAPAIRAALPSGVRYLMEPHEGEATTAPAATRAAGEGGGKRSWVLPLVILALIPAIWLISRAHKPAVETPSTATGIANRSIPDANGVIPGPSGKLDLRFQPGSMDLDPEAQDRLRDYASVLAANPDVRISVNGYTDSTGGDMNDLRLSQERADTVKGGLIRLGIPAERITARGFGKQYPVGDNATPDGRAANNRVTVEMGER